jgi:TfoX/Sxy family transcriptional regulator of competence genes
MSGRDTFRDFVLEQLGGVPEVVARPMFGGHGLYAGGRALSED